MIKNVEAARKEFERRVSIETSVANKQDKEKFEKMWRQVFETMIKFKTRSIKLREEHSWFAKDEFTVSSWFIDNADKFLKAVGYSTSISFEGYSKDGMGRLSPGHQEHIRILILSLD
jgi:hypothetical protein